MNRSSAVVSFSRKGQPPGQTRSRSYSGIASCSGGGGVQKDLSSMSNQAQFNDREFTKLMKLDDEFNALLEVIQKVMQYLSKHQQVRADQWVKKLSENTSNYQWKLNRNIYAKTLTHMVVNLSLEGPFASSPPDTPLPRICRESLPPSVRNFIRGFSSTSSSSTVCRDRTNISHLARGKHLREGGESAHSQQGENHICQKVEEGIRVAKARSNSRDQSIYQQRQSSKEPLIRPTYQDQWLAAREEELRDAPQLRTKKRRNSTMITSYQSPPPQLLLQKQEVRGREHSMQQPWKRSHYEVEINDNHQSQFRTAKPVDCRQSPQTNNDSTAPNSSNRTRINSNYGSALPFCNSIQSTPMCQQMLSVSPINPYNIEQLIKPIEFVSSFSSMPYDSAQQSVKAERISLHAPSHCQTTRRIIGNKVEGEQEKQSSERQMKLIELGERELKRELNLKQTYINSLSRKDELTRNENAALRISSFNISTILAKASNYLSSQSPKFAGDFQVNCPESAGSQALSFNNYLFLQYEYIMRELENVAKEELLISEKQREICLNNWKDLDANNDNLNLDDNYQLHAERISQKLKRTNEDTNNFLTYLQQMKDNIS